MSLFGMPVVVDPNMEPGKVLLVSPADMARLRDEMMESMRYIDVSIRASTEGMAASIHTAMTDLAEAASRASVAIHDLAVADEEVREAEWRREWHRPQYVGTAWWDR